MFHSDLSEKFLRVRKHIGLTQENIAMEIGITTEAYGKIERGKTRITEERLTQIASIFGFEPHELLQLTADQLIGKLIAERKNLPLPPPRR